MTSGRVEVVNSRGCSRLFPGFVSSISSINSFRFKILMLPASSAVSDSVAVGPFTGLIICVTGLSKEARMQVMAATKRLGGHYSSSLHPQCTHLVVQSCCGRKFEHALKHGSRNGLLIVTLGWFVDSVRRNVRLSESLYSVEHAGENDMTLGELNQLFGLSGSEKSCLPLDVFEDEKSLSTIWQNHLQSSTKELRTGGSVLSSDCIYVDSDISTELRKKVVDAATREGAAVLEHWFIGCPASHVVCEGPSIQRYIGHTNHLVTPLWILKTVKEKSLQRLVRLSSDLPRQVAMVLENAQTLTGQSCQLPIHPITPNSLMDSICWSVSEPTSSACIYTESSGPEDASEQHASLFVDTLGDGRHSEVLSDNFSRPLSESEKREVIFKNHFLTILFPIDRFGQRGPSSRTFYS